MNARSVALIAASLLISASTLTAQRAYTAQDYAQAERWMGYNVNSLVDHTVSDVKFLSDGRVFYRDPAAGAVVFRIADARTGKVEPAFDTDKLAAALSKASASEVDAKYLRIEGYTPDIPLHG
jgi:dipeptidyl-peptidase 4